MDIVVFEEFREREEEERKHQESGRQHGLKPEPEAKHERMFVALGETARICGHKVLETEQVVGQEEDSAPDRCNAHVPHPRIVQ